MCCVNSRNQDSGYSVISPILDQNHQIPVSYVHSMWLPLLGTKLGCMLRRCRTIKESAMTLCCHVTDPLHVGWRSIVLIYDSSGTFNKGPCTQLVTTVTKSCTVESPKKGHVGTSNLFGGPLFRVLSFVEVIILLFSDFSYRLPCAITSLPRTQPL